MFDLILGWGLLAASLFLILVQIIGACRTLEGDGG